MNELIKIETREDGSQAVSARELHGVLESKRDFSNWIKDRIEKYNLIENEDYCSFNKIVERETGASTRIEYALTIDTAKELAMVEGNDKGRQVRRYFIEAEKKLKAISNAVPNIENLISDPAFGIKLLTELQKERAETERLQIEVKVSAPKAEYYDKVLQSESTYTTEQIAKELGMSAITLNKKLELMRVQFKRSGTWMLFSHHHSCGYTKTRTHYFNKPDGSCGTNTYTVWTEKGRMFIHDLFNINN